MNKSTVNNSDDMFIPDLREIIADPKPRVERLIDKEPHEFFPKSRIPKTRFPEGGLPPYYYPTPTGVFAKCPKCNSITHLRVCQTCKEVMCEECYAEHQGPCLRGEIGR